MKWHMWFLLPIVLVLYACLIVPVMIVVAGIVVVKEILWPERLA